MSERSSCDPHGARRRRKIYGQRVQAYKRDVKNIMIRMGLLSGEEVHTVQQKNVTRAEYLEAETDGLWYPVFSAGDTFAGGAVLGTVRDIWGNLLREYRADLIRESFCTRR